MGLQLKPILLALDKWGYSNLKGVKNLDVFLKSHGGVKKVEG